MRELSARGYIVRGTCTCPEKHTPSWGGFGQAELGEAIAAAERMRWNEDVTDVRIYAVAEDGTETALPSYEEALAVVSAARDVVAMIDPDDHPTMRRLARTLQGTSRGAR